MKKFLQKLQSLFSPYPQIRGECKKCGKCCKNLILVDKGKPITTENQFEKAKKRKPEYRIFEPHKKEYADAILRFNCTKLTKENLCSIHKTRPDICRNYPTLVMFRKGATLLEGCGYRLVTKDSFEAIMDKKKKNGGSRTTSIKNQ